jgi:hypothetical protein
MNRQGAKNAKEERRKKRNRERDAAGIQSSSACPFFSLSSLGVPGVLAVH